MTQPTLSMFEGDELTIGVDLTRMTNAATRVLAADPLVYQRAGMLSHVVRLAEAGVDEDGEDLMPTAWRRPKGAPSILALQPPTVRERLADGTIWIELKKGRRYQALPPMHVVSTVMARGQWEGVRVLSSVIEAPALRPDGTVIQTEGYDAATGCLYLPSEAFPPVPDEPTRDDVALAVADLQEVFTDFPFASAAASSAMLALLLTPFARPAIEGCCPMFVLDGTTPGLGKSLGVDACAVLATGRVAARTTQPADEEEFRKRTTAILLEGDPLTLIDNIAAPLGGANLDAVLTSTIWKDRLLGATEMKSIPARTVWAGTGNNIELVGDISRRVLVVRMESGVENPEDRDDFKHPQLLAWLRQERPRLVRAALIILRGHAVAGRPQTVKPFGSFEDWCRIVASAIVWAGLPDPSGARVKAGEDPAKATFAALLAGWKRLDGGEGLTVKTAIGVLYPNRASGEPLPPGHDDLREAIETLVPTPQGKTPSSSKLSYVLRRWKKRIVGGSYLDSVSAHAGAVKWLVRP